MLRLYTTLKFSRPIGPDTFPSVGGFEVKLTDGTHIGFDFMESCYSADSDDPNVIHVTGQYPDKTSFPDFDKLERSLHLIDTLTECYIDTEVFSDMGLEEPILENILSFTLESDNMPEDHPNTEKVSFLRSSEEHVCTHLQPSCWEKLITDMG